VNGADNSRHDCPCDFGNVRSRAASKGVLPTGPWRVHDRDELRHAKLWFAGKQNNGSSLLMRLTRSRKAWRTPQGCIQPLTAFLSPR